MRGSVARDLHGAFAEWEAQAHTLTRCTNYLYSLSINPDQRQGRLTKEQYLDYIDRAEQRLGLSGQPRAVVFHVKKDGRGVPREHCHVIWSRIDVERGKARHVAFDHEKLMTVTREFARDHGLRLPDGYHKDKKAGPAPKGRQMTVYEKKQEDLRRRIDGAAQGAGDGGVEPPRYAARLRPLAGGYGLHPRHRRTAITCWSIASGNMNSLPKLIDDKKVRIKHLREFLARTFRPTPCRPWTRRGRWPPRIAPRWSCSAKARNGPPRRSRKQRREDCSAASSRAAGTWSRSGRRRSRQLYALRKEPAG